MKQKLLGLIILVVLILTGLFWSVASAQSFKSGNNITIGPDQTVNSMLWAAGRTVNIAGRVNGDVFCAAQTVTITGTVSGDVLCAAQHIVISGRVDGNVRAASQAITLSAVGVRNLTVAAQSFVQEPRSQVARDASIAASDVTMNGLVGRDAALAATDITLAGKIGRNVEATVNTMRLSSSASVGGNIHYTSTQNAQVSQGATVGGKIIKATPQQASKKQPAANAFGAGVAITFYLFLAGLVTALVLVLLFPQAFHAITWHGLRAPWKTLLVGFIAALVVPALILLLMITVVGIPLGLLLLGVWILIQALAGFVAAYYLGRLLWRSKRNPVLLMLVGFVVLAVLLVIPVINILALLLAMLMGIGMLLLELRERWPKPTYDLTDTQA